MMSPLPTTFKKQWIRTEDGEFEERAVFATYELRLIGEGRVDDLADMWDTMQLSLMRGLRETEENLTSLLPEGYSVSFGEVGEESK